MSVNLASLTAYVEEKRLPLIRKASLGAPTVKYFTIQTGVKGETAINILNTAVTLGDGSKCGWDEAGTSTFSQRKITPAMMKVNMSFCDREMAKYWMNYDINVAAGKNNLPFEEEFINGVNEEIQKKIEKFIWADQTEIGGVQYKGIQGLITADSIEATETTGATTYEKLIELYEVIPADSLGDEEIFMGVDAFRTLVLELSAKNLYHYDPKVDTNFTIVLPGTNTKVHGVPGLNGSNKVIALNPKHTYVGVDMQGDEEKFDFWFSKDNQEYRLNVCFNCGVQYAFTDEVKFISLA